MSDAANVSYALVQAVHNYGAVAVVGGPAAAVLWAREQKAVPMVLAWLTLSGWIVQGLSGIGFAVTSYLSQGELPEVTGIALVALAIKVTCALVGFSLIAWYMLATSQKREAHQRKLFPALFFIGFTALTGAAFLRWFG